MTEITFTHTQFQSPVTVYAELIFAVVYAPTMKSVVLVATGGAAVPVEGQLEEVKTKVSQAKTATNKES